MFLFFMIFFFFFCRRVIYYYFYVTIWDLRQYCKFHENTLHYILSSHALLFHETVSGLRDGVSRQGGKGFSDPEALNITWRVWTEVWCFKVRTPASCECITTLANFPAPAHSHININMYRLLIFFIIFEKLQFIVWSKYITFFFFLLKPGFNHTLY